MNSPSDQRKNGEGLVVTASGQRISGQVHATTESAEHEAAIRRHKQLHEKADGASASPPVEIKRQLFG